MAGKGTIGRSVGKGGKNDTRDVIVVQALLRNTARLIISDWPPGNCGKSTIAAIEKFQKDVVKLRKPDGLISPGGSTIKALTFVKLPLAGHGWYSYGEGVDDKHWGVFDTVESIRKLAGKVKDQMGLEVGVSDISLRMGGKLEPHTTHRDGVDVDIRPIRQDGLNKACWITWTAIYDRTRTQKFVDLALEDPNTKKILFNDRQVSGVHWSSGHHHHLHISYAIRSHPYSSIERSFDMLRGRVGRGLADALDFW